MHPLLEIPILAAHLACMNVAAGAPLVALWLEWKDRRGDYVGADAARYLAAASMLTMIVGAALGGLIGWLRWTPAYREIWAVQLADELKWGVRELIVSALVLVAYWLWRSRAEMATRVGFLGRSALLMFTATNLLYHFPPLMAIAAKLADGAIDPSIAVPGQVIPHKPQFRDLMFQDEIPALTVHFALASIALGGLMLLGLALRRMKVDLEIRNAKRIAAWGGWAALGATGLQLVVGLWLLATTPPDLQAQLTGNSLWPTLCLGTSLVAVVWLLKELSTVTLGEPTRGAMIRSMIAMTVVIVLMTAARQLSRPAPARVNVRAATNLDPAMVADIVEL